MGPWRGPSCDDGTPLVLALGSQRLEVGGRTVTVVDDVHHTRFVTPPDQMLAVTEIGEVALFGDVAARVTGACAAARVREVLASVDEEPRGSGRSTPPEVR